ncbi:MAG: M20/M25/M40 family metallo-hydrolase [Pyramidobacter sp.]
MTEQQRALLWVDEHFDEMISELKMACSYESTASNESGREAMRQQLVNDFKKAGLTPEVTPVEGGNAILTAYKSGNSPKTLLFYGHYDVVEAGAVSSWSTGNPFKAVERGGKLYARGISDDKAGVYFRLHAVRAMLAANGSLPVSVKFLVEGDEESSSCSMNAFARNYPDKFKEMTRSDVCLWENGRIDASGHPWLRCGVRGSVAFDLRIKTAETDVHSRMGTTVPSASWRLIHALSTLTDASTNRSLIDGFYDDVLPETDADKQVLENFPYDEERMKKKLGIKSYLRGASGLRLKEQMYMEPSLSVCAIEAGEAHHGVRGIVPHKAYARLSIYLSANQEPDDIERKLRAHLFKHGFSDIEVSRCPGGDAPVRTNPDHPFRYCAERAAREIFTAPMVVELTQLGAGPAGVFRKAWPELPIFGIGPANPAGNHHSPDENIVIEDYKKCVKYMIVLCYSYKE